MTHWYSISDLPPKSWGTLQCSVAVVDVTLSAVNRAGCVGGSVTAMCKKNYEKRKFYIKSEPKESI